MTTGAKKHPDFFKVFLPEQSSERLLIPNSFVRLINMQGRIPEDVILRNCGGRVWHVKTGRIGEKLYFDDGWKVFQEENCLGKADFLVFEYDGSNEFKVLILEISTQCEKTVVKMEEEENVEEEAEAQEVDEMEVREEEEHEQVEEGKIEDEEDSEDEDYDSDDEDDSAYDNGSDEDSGMEEEIEEEHSAGSIGRSYLRACKRETESSSTPRVEGPLEVYEFDPEMYIQPENPYFEAKLYKSRRNELHIPGNVIKDFSLTFHEKVTLFCCGCCQRRDFQEIELREYHLSLAQHAPIRKRYLEVSGEVCRWLDGRVCVKGWLSFCRRNKMTKYDTCLCEIISGEDQIVRMFRVHVLCSRRG
ncbi:B3 domain-containing protein REM20 [Cajanus cajan]|uniref:B3 domain-containing protein REM21 n=1 Tax=Cajanus cajan TaxID=3821 RepID=A0A151TG38_CAJCA|nr:B3 domain-containing protein REM20 [Cajanus cajan]KYP66012.1 B3 domain-containing protein REM21 [Cajanus cajan]